MTQASMSAKGMRSLGNEVPAAEASQWVQSASATLVDVREPEEHAANSIPGSVLNPLSRFDASALPRAGRIVFHCKTGLRSKEALARAAAAGRGEVYWLSGGIKGWERAGLPVEKRPGVPISIIRQVQITAGSIVLVFSVLAVAVSAWFALGAAFIGAGLIFAGASGFCGMGVALTYMPWNKAARVGCGAESVRGSTPK